MIENVNIYLLVKLQRRGKGGLGLFREITVYIYIIEWSICVTGNIRFF